MLETIWNFISFHPEISIIGVITLIQIAPIKLNPWGFIAKGVRNLIVGGLESKINDLVTKVENLDKQVQEDKALHARAHILRFADGLYNGKHHTKEYFEDMLSDIDDYEKYCREHPDFKNNKTVMSVKMIKTAYEEQILNNPIGK